MQLGNTVPQGAHCEGKSWKAPLLLSLLLGIAALLTLPPALYKGDSAMAIAVAPRAIRQHMQLPRTVRAHQFMQPMMSQQPVQRVFAEPDQSTDPAAYEETEVEPSYGSDNTGRRETFMRAAAALGLAAVAHDQPASAKLVFDKSPTELEFERLLGVTTAAPVPLKIGKSPDQLPDALALKQVAVLAPILAIPLLASTSSATGTKKLPGKKLPARSTVYKKPVFKPKPVLKKAAFKPVAKKTVAPKPYIKPKPAYKTVARKTVSKKPVAGKKVAGGYTGGIFR